MNDVNELLEKAIKVSQKEKLGFISIGVDVAKALLNKPVEPKYFSKYGMADIAWYHCGECDERLGMGDNYCRNCGRAVKWKEAKWNGPEE